MTWFKIDDAFGDHPKVEMIPEKIRPLAVGVWTLCGTWSAKHLTDGYVPEEVARKRGGSPAVTDALVRCALRLGEPGLWIPVEGGWQFHDWERYQPTRAKVEAEREATRKRVQQFRERRRSEGRNDPGNGGEAEQ